MNATPMYRLFAAVAAALLVTGCATSGGTDTAALAASIASIGNWGGSAPAPDAAAVHAEQRAVLNRAEPGVSVGQASRR